VIHTIFLKITGKPIQSMASPRKLEGNGQRTRVSVAISGFRDFSQRSSQSIKRKTVEVSKRKSKRENPV
jgi:hypothetical protein